ncbi:MAG: hypothetical protein ABFD10_08815 [Prolixibacteraceae bacterium]
MEADIHLTWKRGFFSNTYHLFLNGRPVGQLTGKTFLQSSPAEINEKRYTFKTTGFFRQHTTITDNSVNQVIGEIDYKNIFSRASVAIGDQKAEWRFANIFNSKWTISNSQGGQISYSGSCNRGKIDSMISNEPLLLSGLFIANYYWDITIAFAALFVVFIVIL